MHHRVSVSQGTRPRRLAHSIDGGSVRIKEEKEAAKEKARAEREMARAREESEP